MMEKIIFYLEIMKKYCMNNNLSVDKSTYLTVIFGQITMYGILLTFYQFVADKSDGKKTYLGCNLNECYIKKNVVFLNIVQGKIFTIILILEILYKPLVIVYGYLFNEELINIINFAWFTVVVCYLLLFVIIFVQSAKAILMINAVSDIETNSQLISNINKEFLKKTMKERITKTNIELLCKDLYMYSLKKKKSDNIIEFQNYSDSLLSKIFDEYRKQKKHENIIEDKKYIRFKKGESLDYKSNFEVYLLQEIIDENYFMLDEKNIKIILNFYMKLSETNIERL